MTNFFFEKLEKISEEVICKVLPWPEEIPRNLPDEMQKTLGNNLKMGIVVLHYKGNTISFGAWDTSTSPPEDAFYHLMMLIFDEGIVERGSQDLIRNLFPEHLILELGLQFP